MLQKIQSTRLSNLPIAFFTVTMSLSGFTVAWEKAHYFLGTPQVISTILTFLSLIIFLTLLTIYLSKLIKKPKECKKEFRHYVKSNFFAAMSTTVLLLSVDFLNLTQADWAILTSKILWIIGGVFHFIITLFLLTNWIQNDQLEIKHITPTWFIPITGNMIASVVATYHSSQEISWFFFSVASIFWIIILTILFYRIIFHHPMKEKLLPTFFIIIAPPSAGFIALFKLMGEVTEVSRIFYYFALFMSFLLLFNIKLFSKVEFYLSWWAYSFPIATLTTATLIFYSQTESYGFLFLSVFFLFILTSIILYLTVKTIRAIKNHEVKIISEG